MVIEGGTFFIDAVDDALHSNGDITINSGSFTIASGMMACMLTSRLRLTEAK